MPILFTSPALLLLCYLRVIPIPQCFADFANVYASIIEKSRRCANIPSSARKICPTIGRCVPNGARARGEETGLSDEEIAFYDALAQNESARDTIGEPALRIIAHELVKSLRGSITVDWMHRETARARMRVLVEAHLAQIRVSAGLAGCGRPDGVTADGGVVRGVGKGGIELLG